MLNNKQKQTLRAMAHELRPIVQIGKEGISDHVLESIEVSLEAHELLKVSVLRTAPLDARGCAIEIAAALHAEVIQVIGRTIILYRRSKEHKIRI